MAAANDSSSPPMAEPGKRPTGADVGGMRATADGGLSSATERDSKQGNVEAASTVPAGKAAQPAPAGTGRPGNNFADEEDEWRHAPVAPKDAGVLDSLGRSVSEAVTGADSSPAKPKPDGSR